MKEANKDRLNKWLLHLCPQVDSAGPVGGANSCASPDPHRQIKVSFIIHKQMVMAPKLSTTPVLYLYLFKVSVLEHFSWCFFHFQIHVIQVFIRVPVIWES